MPTALLLDAAGTLITTTEPVGDVYARHFRAHGVVLPADTIHQAFGTVFRNAAPPEFARHPDGNSAERAHWETIVREVLCATGPAGAELATSPSFAPCFEALYAFYNQPEAWQPYPDTLPFLQAAGRNHRLAVVSNFDRRLHTVLDGLGLSPHFEFILTSAEARASKPDPSIFHQALHRLDCPPDEALHFGDCPRNDLEGAHAAGIPAYHVDRPTRGLPENLDFSPPTPN